VISIITNRKQITYTDLVTHLKKCVHDSVERIVLREKDLTPEVVSKKISKIKSDAGLGQVPLLLNGPYPLLETYGADGRHYTFEQFKSAVAQYEKLPFQVGVSAHSIEEILWLNEKSLDYVLYGHIFVTACKAGLQERGLDNLKLILETSKHPVVSLGGISDENYNRILEKGGREIAMMSSVMKCQQPELYFEKFNGIK